MMESHMFEAPREGSAEDESGVCRTFCDTCDFRLSFKEPEASRLIVWLGNHGFVLRACVATRNAKILKCRLVRLNTNGGDRRDTRFGEFQTVTVLVTRSIGSDRGATHVKSRNAVPLAKWRLKRAVEFIDSNIGSPLSLPELARAAGLSRMHFAAQFREATGIRPHTYLLQRRIEKAQAMLTSSNASIVEVALGVGFSTQAHFTEVFKRFSGFTPRQWRQKERPVAANPAVST
jgi:AraC family transcriptional regulator